MGHEGRSRHLVLPRAWCDGTGVEKGTQVTLLYDNVLIVLPPSVTETEIRRLLGFMQSGRVTAVGRPALPAETTGVVP